MAPFVEDLTEFQHTDEWAEDVAVAGFGTVRGIFHEEYQATLEMEGTTPAFECRLTDVAGIARGTNLTRTATGLVYDVREVQPEEGWAVLILEAP